MQTTFPSRSSAAKLRYRIGDGNLDLVVASELVRVAAAELGSGHNRWYAMRRVVEMCSPSIDQALADRIAIEVRVERAERAFRTCLAQISLTTAAYRPKIAEVLQ